MAYIDACLANILWCFVCPVIVVGSILCAFILKLHLIRKRWIAWFMNRTRSIGIHGTDTIKSALFSYLHRLESNDRELKNKGLIRIVEIGCGIGSNFGYYPKNSHLIVIEPNPFTRRYFVKNRKLFPELNLEGYLDGFAEEIFLIPDSCVDAVVSTGVLCTVKDASTVLKEIKRILAPGGKFFYVEHMCHQTGTWRFFIQRCIDPIWKAIFDGCSLSRDIASLIKQNQFSHVMQYRLYEPWGKIIGIFLHPLLVGIATK